ncbi:porimin precursor isoform B [Alligator mississippiensis]|uniref:Porimin isoform B n=1 Tax=Alligator mississippiensis TaxID=8496 RepID=A0A151P7A9_ALLMI|nr:porimin precursor isoform B [Alligator mississippiensis]
MSADPGVTTTSQKPSEHSNQNKGGSSPSNVPHSVTSPSATTPHSSTTAKNVIQTTSLDPPETASTSQSANGTQPVNITQSANGTQPVSTTQSANGTQPVTTTKAANSTQSASTTQATTTAISKPQTSMPSKPNITVTTASTPSTSASVSVTVAQARTSRFDVGSFVGGIVLTLGMLAILYIGCKTYHSRRGIRYRTIDEHDAII